MALAQREMDKAYWNNMARAYETEIHSVLHADREGLITSCIRRIASKRKIVADVGCGIGHFLPILSKGFKHVYANDISPKLLDRARQIHGHLPNTSFLPGDIRVAFRKLPRVNVVVSVNSLIVSSSAIRAMMLKAMTAILKPGGMVLLVVPSLESSLFVDVVFNYWQQKNGMSGASAVSCVYPSKPLLDNKARQGIVPIDGVMTKHYLKEELELLLNAERLKVVSIEKLQYSWDTEFEEPPCWLKHPYPWDWVVMARKK